jgi:uncharacterized ferritin-like protein (DUF455 family)
MPVPDSPESHSHAAPSLRSEALRILLIRDAAAKASAARHLGDAAGDKAHASAAVGAQETLEEPPGVPGRPDQPVLVPHTQLKPRSIATREGRAALLHALTHIEMNAVNLALDVVWRFAGMPAAFYRDWLQVVREEALHFELLRAHLRTLGFDYGDFPAHDGLWEMAEKTKGDLLARLALVPRTLEARGLDASPEVKKKLLKAGDEEGGRILDIILRDEIGHVAIGNRWYREVCKQRGLDVVATYAALARDYGAPRLRGPFNFEARRAAGFDALELAALVAEPPPPPGA